MDKDKIHQTLMPKRPNLERLDGNRIVSGAGVPNPMAERIAKKAKPDFVVFIKALELPLEQEMAILRAGNTSNAEAEDFLSGVKGVRAMRQKLLEIRPDLSDALRNYYGGRSPFV